METTADVPAAGEARIEHQRAVDQRDHRTDVLAEIAQRKGSIGKHSGVVSGHLQCSASPIQPIRPVEFEILAPTADIA